MDEEEFACQHPQAYRYPYHPGWEVCSVCGATLNKQEALVQKGKRDDQPNYARRLSKTRSVA